MLGGAAGLLLASGCRTKPAHTAPSPPPPSGPQQIELPADQQFEVGSVTRIDSRVFVARDERGIYALSAICTHQGCELVFEEGQILCDCHYSTFDLDGAVTNGPAKEPLANYTVSRRPTGEILITLRQVRVGARLPAK